MFTRIVLLACVLGGAPAAGAWALDDQDAPTAEDRVYLEVEPADTAHPEVRLLPRGTLLRLAQAERADPEGPALDSSAVDDDGEGDTALTDPAGVDISQLPRARGLSREARTFWYTMGAGLLSSIIVRSVAMVPLSMAALAATALAGLIGPAATLVLFVGMGVGVITIDAAVAALASTLTFDVMSEFYRSRYLTSFSGHFLGNALAAAVAGLVFAMPMMLIAGITVFTDFAVAELITGFTVFTTIGLIPAFPAVFIASLGLPAILGAWSTSVSASTKEGFVIDPGWFPLSAGRSAPRPAPPTERSAQLFGPRLLLPGT